MKTRVRKYLFSGMIFGALVLNVGTALASGGRPPVEKVFDSTMAAAGSAIGARIAGTHGAVAGAAAGTIAAEGIKEGAKATGKAINHSAKMLSTPPPALYLEDPITGKSMGSPIYLPFYRK